MVQFCETYLRSVSSREVADFKSTTESQLQHFTVFEVYTVIHIHIHIEHVHIHEV